MFASFLAYSSFAPNLTSISIYIIAQIAGVSMWAIGKRSGCDEKYPMYRTLAEALRVRSQWRDLQANQASFRNFRRKHHSQLRWIRLALRAIETDELVVRQALDIEEQKSFEPSTEPNDLDSCWISEQLSYFRRSLRTKKRNMQLTRAAISACYLAGLAASATTFWLTSHNGPPTQLQVTVLMMGAFPGFAALIGSFAQREGWDDDMNQYRHMQSLFERANDVRNKVPREDLVLELGREVLHHNGDWLCASLSRPIELPTI